jgi:hypothetical protein
VMWLCTVCPWSPRRRRWPAPPALQRRSRTLTATPPFITSRHHLHFLILFYFIFISSLYFLFFIFWIQNSIRTECVVSVVLWRWSVEICFIIHITITRNAYS